MSKINPNEIGTVKIDISNSNIDGPFQSPLSDKKSGRSILYIPRYKSIIRNDKLLPSLQKFIGIDKVGILNKRKWVENAQHLFLDKAAIENYLKTDGSSIAEKASPDIIKSNAQYVIREIFFPETLPFKYADKNWVIQSVTDVSCNFTGMAKDENILGQIEATELQEIIKKYRKRLDQYKKLAGVTNEDIALFRKNIHQQQDKEYKEFVEKVDQYRKTKNDPDIENKIKTAKNRAMLHAPVVCKVKLKLVEKKKLTKKEILSRLNNFKNSCRPSSPGHRSQKQKDIIRTCRDLCRSSKYSKWCKTCSVFINCILEPSRPIDSSKMAKAATAMQSVQRGKVSRKKTAQLKKKTTKKVPIQKTGGRKTRHKKRKKCSRRGSNP